MYRWFTLTALLYFWAEAGNRPWGPLESDTASPKPALLSDRHHWAKSTEDLLVIGGPQSEKAIAVEVNLLTVFIRSCEVIDNLVEILCLKCRLSLCLYKNHLTHFGCQQQTNFAPQVHLLKCRMSKFTGSIFMTEFLLVDIWENRRSYNAYRAMPVEMTL